MRNCLVRPHRSDDAEPSSTVTANPSHPRACETTVSTASPHRNPILHILLSSFPSRDRRRRPPSSAKLPRPLPLPLRRRDPPSPSPSQAARPSLSLSSGAGCWVARRRWQRVAGSRGGGWLQARRRRLAGEEGQALPAAVRYKSEPNAHLCAD
jgi:hypothetical protein